MRFTPAPQPQQTNPFRGILWTAAFAVAVLIIVYGGSSLLKQHDKREVVALLPQQAQPKPPLVQTRHEITPPPDAELSPVLTDPSSLADADEGTAIDTNGFYYLLYQSKIADEAQLAAEAIPVPEPGKVAELKPGTPVHLAGTVASVNSRKDLTIHAAGITEPGQYEIKDAAGNLYLVFTTYRVLGVEAGDKVKVVGRYLRRYAYVPYAPLGEDHEKVATLTPVIIARVVDGTENLKDPSCLRTVIDNVKGHEPKPFYYLANLVRGMTQEELKRRSEPSLTPDKLFENPAAARGRYVAIQGTLIVTQPHDKQPNIAGIDRLYWTVIRTRDKHAVWAYTLEEPEDVKRGDAVRVYGIFLKSRWYTTERGYEPTALVVVGRRVAKVVYETPPYLGLAAVIIGIVTLLVLVVAARWDRKHSRQFEKHVRNLWARSRPRHLNEVAKQAAHKSAHAEAAAPPPREDSNGESTVSAPPGAGDVA